MRSSKSAQRYKAALEVANRNLKKLSDAGVTDRDGHRHRPAGAVPGLLRADGAGDDGEGRPDAAAGAGVGDARRRALHEARRELGTLEPDKWADFVVLDADPLRRHLERQKDRLGLDRGNRVQR